MIRRLLWDNSAWARLEQPTLNAGRLSEISDAIQSGDLFVCLPFLLEAGYSARGGKDHDQLFSQLLALPWAGIDSAVENRALDAQRQLSRVGHHRIPPVDLLIAAVADRHQLGVLHYDGDYDLIVDKTDLSFESSWLAKPGSL